MGPVDKAMEVLSALVETGAPHRLADLARRTGLTKPTVHRLLRGLAGSGFASPPKGAATGRAPGCWASPPPRSTAARHCA